MLNINEFMSYFSEKGISTIFTNHISYDNKLNYFLKHLNNKYNSIADNDRINVLDELDKFKNTTVLILKPTNSFDYDDGTGDQPWQMKKKYISSIYTKSVENNLSIILFTYSYKTQNKYDIDHKQMLMSNLVIEYKDNKIHLLKNRYADIGSFDIDLLRPIWINEEREDKLNRILKKKQIIHNLV